MDAPRKTFIEFFAGIGLVREALQTGGWTCVYANDIAAKKQEVYELRFGADPHFQLGDVWETDDVVARIPPSPFLATASFPCTDLSLAGHWRGLHGEHSSAFFGFARVLDQLGPRRPSVVLLENVPGLLTSRGGADFAVAVSTLAELGYWLDAIVLDAKYFVPQSRPRVFIVGFSDSLRRGWNRDRPPNVLLDAARELSLSESVLRPARIISLMHSTQLATGWLALDLPEPTEQRRDVVAVVDVDDEQDWWDDAAVQKHHNMMSDRHRADVDRRRRIGGLHVGTIFRRKRRDGTRAEVRFDGLAGCLRTPSGGSARQIVIVIDAGRLRMRWMSPREYARLQGADDFPLLANVNQMLYGFGDAVCVPVIRWLDDNVLSPAFASAATTPVQQGVSLAG